MLVICFWDRVLPRLVLNPLPNPDWPEICDPTSSIFGTEFSDYRLLSRCLVKSTSDMGASKWKRNKPFLCFGKKYVQLNNRRSSKEPWKKLEAAKVVNVLAKWHCTIYIYNADFGLVYRTFPNKAHWFLDCWITKQLLILDAQLLNLKLITSWAHNFSVIVFELQFLLFRSSLSGQKSHFCDLLIHVAILQYHMALFMLLRRTVFFFPQRKRK